MERRCVICGRTFETKRERKVCGRCRILFNRRCPVCGFPLVFICGRCGFGNKGEQRAGGKGLKVYT